MPEKITSTHSWFMERRYFSLIIASAFIILSTSAFFICYRHHVVNTEQALKEDRSAANLLSLLLDEHLKKIISVMESYGNRPLLIQAVKDKNALKAKVHLISLTKRNPDIDGVIITDRQGTLWAAYPERPEVLGKNFAYRDWYKGVSKEWKPYISDAYLRVVAEKDCAVGIVVPFFNEEGEVIGILHKTYRTVSMINMIKQLPLDPGASISIANRKGQLIYSTRYDVEKEIRLYPFHADMKKAMAAKNKTFAVDDHEFGGRARYISFAPVGNIGWTVFMGRDKRSIFMSEITYYIQVITISVLLFLSIIIFLFYSRKQVTAQQLMEQLQAEKKLRTSRERFKSYIDVTMQLAWTTNDQGEIVEDNPSWSKYTGRGYEAYKGFGWIEDIHPDDRERTGQIWGKAVAEKSFYETEYRIRRYDGVYRNYLARGIPLLAEDGTFQEWVGTCIDITEIKWTEEALILSELKYRTIFENAVEGIFQSTPEGRYVVVNPAFARIGGYSSPEEMMESVIDIQKTMYVHQEDRKRLLDLLNKQDMINDFETEIRRRDGAIIWISMNVRTIKDQDHRIIFLEGTIQDITGRKRAEEGLRHATDRLDMAQTVAGVGIWDWDIIAGHIEWTAQMFDLLGIDRTKTVGSFEAWRNVIHPEDVEMAGIRIDHALKERKNLNSDYRVVLPGGRIRWINAVGKGAYNDQSQPVRMMGICIDITERKRMEEALQESEARLSTIFKNDPTGIFIVNGKTRIIYDVNDSALEIIGLPREDVVGKVCHRFLCPAEMGCCPICDLGQVIDRSERVLLKPDGTRVPILKTVVPIQLKGENYLLESFIDITERKQAEETLKQSEEKYRNLFDNAMEGVYQTTPEGRLISANKALARMFDYASPEEMINTIADLASQIYANQDDRKIAAGIFKEKRYIKGFECQMRRKDGSIFWARYDGQFTKTEDGIPCFQGFVIDITDRKEAEEEIRKLNAELEQRVVDRTIQLEAANKELDAFSYSVSHDLRAPLRSIDGFSQVLLEEYQERLDEAGKADLLRIRKATQKMGFLIDDLLKLSRVTQSEFHRESIALSHMVRANAETHQKNSPDRGVDVTIQEEIHVQGDPYLMQIAIENLMANAWKFTGKEAHPRIEFGTTVRDGETVYFIRDNGVGFDMAYVQKLFGAFQRLHKTDEFPGTGIGLATVKRIINRHGGKVWAEGEVGKGATFYFTIPKIR